MKALFCLLLCLVTLAATSTLAEEATQPCTDCVKQQDQIIKEPPAGTGGDGEKNKHLKAHKDAVKASQVEKATAVQKAEKATVKTEKAAQTQKAVGK